MRERLDLEMTDAEIERAIVDGVVARYRLEGAPRIDGAVEAVRRIAADRPVAVASSAHRAVIDAALAATGLADAFPVVVSSDEVAHGKPEPDVYLEAARRLGREPSACLVVEDSKNGVRAATAAGMTVVLVPNRSVPPAPGPMPWPTSSSTGSPTSIRPRSAETGRWPTPRQGPCRARLSSPRRRTVRYWVSRIVVAVLTRAYLRPRRVAGAPLPAGPAIYCFNHMSWADPFVLMALLPYRPRLCFFGPKEEDMGSAAGTGS